MNWIVDTTVVLRVDTTVVPHKRIIKELLFINYNEGEQCHF